MNKRNDPNALTDSYEVTVAVTHAVLVRHARNPEEALQQALVTLRKNIGIPDNIDGSNAERLEAWEVSMVVGSADYVV